MYETNKHSGDSNLVHLSRIQLYAKEFLGINLDHKSRRVELWNSEGSQVEETYYELEDFKE